MIAVCVHDLMDRSRFNGHDVRFVTSPSQVGDASLVVVDISRSDPALWAEVAATRTVVGFGSHVDRDRFEAAEQAGFARVAARSDFFADLGQLASHATHDKP